MQDTGIRWLCSAALVCFMQLGYASAQSPSQVEPDTVEITWVANHGFQIAGAGKKVMIDTLFTEGGGYYHWPSRSTRAKMEHHQRPFDNVDVVLTTHHHGDHFDSNFTVEYLLSHPHVQFLGPEEVVTAMRGNRRFDLIRATATTVEGRAIGTFNGVDIEHITIPHHGDPDVQHMAYLVHLNGLKILHIGDAAKIPLTLYETLALSNEEIDILIAPFGAGCSNWMTDANGDGVGVIRDYIKPKCVIMGHMTLEWDRAAMTTARAELQAQLPDCSVCLLRPQPCTGTLLAKQDGQIVETLNPNHPIENQTTGRRFCSLHCAINDAAPGDVIVLEPGTYKESITLEMDITLQSLDPNDPYHIGSTIIEGHAADRVLTLRNTSKACTIAGLTLRAGLVGVSGITADATLSHCRIMDNVTCGMELFAASSPHLEHCLITANGQTGITMHATTDNHTAIDCEPLIDNCFIMDNGAAALEGGEPVIVDSLIDGNGIDS